MSMVVITYFCKSTTLLKEQLEGMPGACLNIDYIKYYSRKLKYALD